MIQISIPKTIYVPGEVLTIEVTIKNDSPRAIRHLKIKLKEFQTFEGDRCTFVPSEYRGSKTQRDIKIPSLTKINENVRVAPGPETTVRRTLHIPLCAAPDLKTKHIEVSHALKVYLQLLMTKGMGPKTRFREAQALNRLGLV